MQHKAQPRTEEPRGAEVIRLATQIMAKGCRGWSDALEQARKQVK